MVGFFDDNKLNADLSNITSESKGAYTTTAIVARQKVQEKAIGPLEKMTSIKGQGSPEADGLARAVGVEKIMLSQIQQSHGLSAPDPELTTDASEIPSSRTP